MTIQENYKSYVICTSPRSGSTLLCKLLEATGKAGNPDSHFHTPSVARWLEIYELSIDDFGSDRDALAAVFAAAYERGKGRTEIFGLRLQRGSFDFFIQKITELYPGFYSDVARIHAAFGKTLFIHLFRPNKIDQAISRVKAEQTGIWHKNVDGTKTERHAPFREAYYDAESIERHVSELTELDQNWKEWFEQEKIRPYRISYDELSIDPRTILSKLLGELGLGSAIADNLEAPTEKLSDEVSVSWAKRFLQERRS